MEALYSKWRNCTQNGGTVFKMESLYSKWRYCIQNGGTIFKMEALYSKWRQYISSDDGLALKTIIYYSTCGDY